MPPNRKHLGKSLTESCIYMVHFHAEFHEIIGILINLISHTFFSYLKFLSISILGIYLPVITDCETLQ